MCQQAVNYGQMFENHYKQWRARLPRLLCVLGIGLFGLYIGGSKAKLPTLAGDNYTFRVLWSTCCYGGSSLVLHPGHKVWPWHKALGHRTIYGSHIVRDKCTCSSEWCALLCTCGVKPLSSAQKRPILSYILQ